ncbi:MAG: beta-galactosidase [Lachnospirales bacterium]
MVNTEKINKVLYGGDYNPEQWERDVWYEDMRLLKEANIDIVTLNVFNWAYLQKDDDEYDFNELDEIINLATKHEFKICLATSTGAHPAWMAKKYPEITRTGIDGKKRKFGDRHNSCPSSKIYRKYSAQLALKLAERYGEYPNLVGWHISNEYGGICYCENCEKKFREWLKDKYNSIDNVNYAWNTRFWGHTFYDFDEIVVPNLLSEHTNKDATTFQGISLDYNRFNNENILECFKIERDSIRKFDKQNKITTNLMGKHKALDYKKWTDEMDFISWDNYPLFDAEYFDIAFNHDYFRSLKKDTPFILMEQTPSSLNYQPTNPLKRPGVMRLQSYQAMAHGADGIMFFQMRRSRGACEKFHGAVIDHVGTENTRVFKEISELGKELEKIGDLTLGAVTNAKVALIVDWESWWALDFSSGPTYRIDYIEECVKYYSFFSKSNISIDIINSDDDFTNYEMIIAPNLYMMKNFFEIKINEFVKNGGVFLTTFLSGIVDENDLVHLGGYPSPIREISGIWIEEMDDLPHNTKNSFIFDNIRYPAQICCDIIHLEGAKSLGNYEDDFYQGHPAITVNQFGKGKVYYVATSSNYNFKKKLLIKIIGDMTIRPVIDTPEYVEATYRENNKGKFIFLLNHNCEDVKFISSFNGENLLNNEIIHINEVIHMHKYDVCIYKLI